MSAWPVDSPASLDPSGSDDAALRAAEPLGQAEDRSADEAWRAIRLLHDTVASELDMELHARHSLSLTEFEVLHYLAATARMQASMSELASGVALSAAGVTRVIGQLVGDGVVARERRGKDRRVLYARLTPMGQAKVTAARHTYDAVLRRCLGPLLAEATAVADAARKLVISRHRKERTLHR